MARPPAAHVLERKTPRSLVRTLVALRAHPPYCTPTDMAARLGQGIQTFKQWEDPTLDLQLKVQVLQRYQDELGIPMGIILIISQILSAARDDRREQLQVLAKMFRSLLKHVDTEQTQDKTMTIVNSRTSYGGWDRLLSHLIEDIYTTPTTVELNAWKHPQRIAHHKKQHESRKLRYAERVKTGRKVST